LSAVPPVSAPRRPIADVFRATAHWAVSVCIRIGIHADAISYSSMVMGALAGVCFWQAGETNWLFIPAAGFCYLRLWMNMLDGMVALASNTASSRGELLNDLPDRVSDVLIFAGVAHSGLCLLPLGYWAAIFALLTAYVGTFGQAVGTQRQFGGWMSKPWRMVALHLGSWLMLADCWDGSSSKLWTLTILDGTLLLIIVGCVQTIVVRLARILRTLRERDAA
jgi:phosphatidylglycerophosphate synthase